MNKTELDLISMGQRIVDSRKKLGMTQETLAEKANVSAQFISYAETGKRSIRAENLMRISAALNVSADYLLTGETIEKDYNIALNKVQELTPEHLLLVSKIINDILEMQK